VLTFRIYLPEVARKIALTQFTSLIFGLNEVYKFKFKFNMLPNYMEQHYVNDARRKLEEGESMIRAGPKGVASFEKTKERVKADFKPEIFFIG